MIHQHPVHLQRRNLLAAAVDDLLQPPGQLKVAVAVEGALVAALLVRALAVLVLVPRAWDLSE